MNDSFFSAQDGQPASPQAGGGKTAGKSKFVYALLALLPTGFFGIAEFYIGRKILGIIICAATLLLPVLDSGSDPDPSPGTDKKPAAEQRTPESPLQELIDFFPTMVCVLYLASFASGFVYIRNNCRE